MRGQITPRRADALKVSRPWELSHRAVIYIQNKVSWKQIFLLLVILEPESEPQFCRIG